MRISIIYLPNGYKTLIKLDRRPSLKGLKDFEIGKYDDLLILRNQNFDKSKEFINMIDLVHNK